MLHVQFILGSSRTLVVQNLLLPWQASVSCTKTTDHNTTLHLGLDIDLRLGQRLDKQKLRLTAT